jgi:hypothetical protein
MTCIGGEGMTTNEQLQSHATRILEQAKRQGNASLRLLGGLAIRRLYPDVAGYPPLQRVCKDIDFAVSKRDARGLSKIFETANFVPERQFNALHGETRLMYSAGPLQADVFVGAFEQCHKLMLEPRLRLLEDTLPPADLLLMKLQVVEMNEKDLQDLCVIFASAEFGDRDTESVINMDYILSITSHDWGWYTTCMDSLEKVTAYAEGLPNPLRCKIVNQINNLRSQMEAAPKGLRWKLRSAIGRRIQWYELPEETRR